MRRFLLTILFIAALIAGAFVYSARPYGPGMMGGWGPAWMTGGGRMADYGPRSWGFDDRKLGADQVKAYFERMLSFEGNPRIKVGEVKEKDADTITADIVTKDKEGLVQRFMVNRHSGYYRTEE